MDREFEHRGRRWGFRVVTTPAGLDQVEEELNRFEALNQHIENGHQLIREPQVEFWGELLSFGARFKVGGAGWSTHITSDL